MSPRESAPYTPRGPGHGLAGEYLSTIQVLRLRNDFMPRRRGNFLLLSGFRQIC